MAKIAFIGLGVMGYPMAGHLATQGHSVWVYNRTPEKSARWTEQFQGTQTKTPQAAAQKADFVITCVGNDADLRAVLTGPEGAFHAPAAGKVFIDHSTTSAEVARAMAAYAAEHDASFLDAPISGGEAGAQQGRLSIMVGGAVSAFSTAEPILHTYGHMIKHMGASGNGQLTKMVNQICIAGLVQALAEALHFAERSGINPLDAMQVIEQGAAQSWQLSHRHKSMLAREFNFGFAVDWMRKDLEIVLDEARVNGAQLPVTALVDHFYAQIQAMGGRRWDTSSLIARLDSAPKTTTTN